jgi:hypothetical protein
MAQAPRSPTPEDDSGQPLMPPEAAPPEDTAPQPPSGRRVRIGLRDFEITDPELAAALEARERDRDVLLDRQGRELGELRTWRRQMEEQRRPEPPPNVYDYNTLIFERPAEALQHFGSSLEERITSNLTRQYELAERQRENWRRFYRDHPELEGEDRLVRAIAGELLQRSQWTESDDVGGFFSELGREVSAELLRLSRKARESHGQPERLTPGRRTVEGSGTRERGAERAPPPEPSTPFSGTDYILEIQRKKAAARRAIAE